MGIPSNPLPTETVEIGAVAIEIRGLHLFQIRQLGAMDADESDAQAIAWATGATIEEAKAWIESSPGGDAVALMAAIMRASAWDPGAGARFPA